MSAVWQSTGQTTALALERHGKPENVAADMAARSNARDGSGRLCAFESYCGAGTLQPQAQAKASSVLTQWRGTAQATPWSARQGGKATPLEREARRQGNKGGESAWTAHAETIDHVCLKQSCNQGLRHPSFMEFLAAGAPNAPPWNLCWRADARYPGNQKASANREEHREIALIACARATRACANALAVAH